MPTKSTPQVLQRLYSIDPSSPDFLRYLYRLIQVDDKEQYLINLGGSELSRLVDFLDKALSPPLAADDISRRCLHKLQVICGHHSVLPSSYTLIGDLARVGDEPVASGGFSDVWEGILNGDKVCIKYLRCCAQNRQSIEKAFYKEAIIWKRLEHPNIVPFISVTQNPMQFVSGWMPNGTLTDYVNKNPDADRIGLLLDVAKGLAYLHANHNTHGDLKGDNVLVDQSNHARLTDFGFASVVRELNSVLVTQVQGYTARWAAPEVLEKGDKCTREADVFALGMVVVEVFNGEPPFSGFTTYVATSKILEGVRPCRPRHPGLIDSVWDITLYCWHQDPVHRPKITKVVKVLRECCEQQSVNRFLTPLTSPQSMKGAKKPRSLIPRWIRSLLPGKSPTPEQSTDLETLRDLRCVSWLLQNSVDEDVHTSAMNFLMSAPDLAEIIQMQYRDGGQVPDWILRFALHCLSLDPLPPASTVAECLKIIAFDLRCEVPNVTILDKGAEAEQTCSLIAEKLETAIEADDSALITSKREAVCALLPYAIFLEQGDRQGMVAAIIRAAKASKTCWFFNPVGSYITALFGKPSSSSLNWLLTIVSPHIDWENKVDGENAVVRWAAAASAVPDTEEVRQSVVDTLLQIASIHSLRPHIPIEIWAWLKKRPSLPPVCSGRSRGTTADTIRYVRGLGDFEIVKSYFLLVWSEWDDLCIGGLDEMETSIREEFGGIGMWGHREDLIGWLDYVLERLGRGLEYLEQHNPQVKQYRVEAAGGQYRKLKEVLVDADGETMKTLVQSHSTFTCALPFPCL